MTDQKKEEIEEINRNVVALKNMMETLHELVEDQQSDMNTIEDAILSSKTTVHQATTQLEQTDYSAYRWIQTGMIATAASTLILIFLL